MFDCHVHSTFSADSGLDADIACKEAINKRLEGIVFTDHIDVDFLNGKFDFSIDFNKYQPYMQSLQEKFKGKLNVLYGIEAGYQSHVLKETIDIIDSNRLDYVLMSLHIVDGMDPYEKLYYIGKTKRQAYEGYLKGIYEMISNIPNFDMLGHIDYIVRCAEYEDRDFKYSELSDLIDEIFKKLILNGKGFEINTGTYRDNSLRPVLSFDIKLLERYRELGGELVCLSSDSHKTEHIGYKFDVFREILQRAGFNKTVHFENRKPVFIKI